MKFEHEICIGKNCMPYGIWFFLFAHGISTERLLLLELFVYMIGMEVKNMDCNKVGQLILKLRKEKNMTQKSLAAKMNISDRTISKWERGIGCPDVSLLNELSKILGVNIDQILSGKLELNETDGGNMKKVKFYVCPFCGNVICSTGEAEISCCGRKLKALAAGRSDSLHEIQVEEIEDEYYVTIQHDMDKQHYIAFAACVSYDRVLLVKLYPEQSPQLRFPRLSGGELYLFCSRHGLIKIGKIGSQQITNK